MTSQKYGKDRAALKGFWAQHPAEKRMFGEIFKVWIKSTATISGKNGYWAAYIHLWWGRRIGVSQATVKRYLDCLEKNGLIERELSHHSGKPVSFIRPTDYVLKLSDGYDKHWDHLHQKHFWPTLDAKNQLFKPIQKPAPTPKPEDKPIESLDELLAILNSK